MLLAIDIGNTNISFGVFSGAKIIKRFNILTKKYSLKKLKKVLSNADIEHAVICSVVPGAAKIIGKGIQQLLNKRPLIVGRDIAIPVVNLYRKPKEVGHDRLVNAYAGITLYGAPLIVVDFGTAVTFDVISKDKKYLGGMILPGLDISLSALAENTALLPRVSLRKPREFIGRETKSSMLSGIVYGFAGLSDNFIMKIRGLIGRDALAIGTGGNIKLIGRHCLQINKIDKDLTLKGLNLVYRSKLS